MPTEAEAVAGPAVFAEWLAAFDRRPATPDQRLSAVAGFLGLDPAQGWAGNLRRGKGDRVAIRRGEHAWTYGDIATSEAAWSAAAGPLADGGYDALRRIAADHLLRADTRPDDILIWGGDPADPWPFGALLFGATVVFRPPAADRDAR